MGGTYRYGQVWYPNLKRVLTTHRVAFALANNVPISSLLPAQLICHHCDNPPCCRPEHLFLGDKRANARDMAQKGRGGVQRDPTRAERGEDRYCAKLTEAQVREICLRHTKGLRHGHTPNAMGAARLAHEYGISTSQVKRIIRGESWKHIP